MALWQHDTDGERFDDGLTAKPGDEGFTRELAEKHFADKSFSYLGTPNWVPPEPPPEPGSVDEPAA